MPCSATELKYWQLFPAPEDFGNIPVWGFGDVIASRHPGCFRRRAPVRLFSHGDASGDRSRPTSASAACATPPRIGKAWRRSTIPMRGSAATPPLPAVQGDHQALLRPLFMLSFLVDDFLSRDMHSTARGSLMLTSASSKTAFGLAHLLHTRHKRRPGDRTHLGGQCRFRPVARLLRRGRDLRPQ